MTTSPSSRRRIVGLLMALAATLPATGAILAADAHAATYPAYACDVPGINLPAPSRGGWTDYDSSGQVQHWQDCTSRTTGGSMWFQINYPTGVLGQNTGVGVELTVPSSGPKAAISIARVTDWSTSALSPQAAGQPPAYGVGLAPGIAAAPGGDTSGWNGTATTGAGHDSGPLAADTKLHRLGVQCAYYGGGYTNCTLPSPFLRIRGIKALLREDVQPTGSVDGGSLLAQGAKAGTKTLVYSAADAESGVERVQVLLGGVVVATEILARDLTLPVAEQTGPCTYSGLQACPASSSGVINVDTTRVAEGSHELALRVIDAASNSRTMLLSDSVLVDNYPLPSVSANPTVGGVAKVPNELVSFDGSWSGATGSTVRQWEACDADGGQCVPLAGQVGTRLTLTPELVGQRIRVAVTRANAAGEALTARSALTTAIPAPDPGECLSCGTRRGATTPGAPGSTAPEVLGVANNGQGATRQARLTATFRGQSKRTVRVPFARRLTVAGTVRDEHAGAISGAVVIVSARERRPGAQSVVVGMPRTAADGSYSYQLPVGPSREITVAYKANLADQRASASVELATTVPASVSASAARSVRINAPLRLRGKLNNLPRRGIKVTIQALDGRTWRTIGEVKTAAKGAYRWTYRFRNPGSAGKRFAFRARVADPLYPFNPGQSRTVMVRVHR